MQTGGLPTGVQINTKTGAVFSVIGTFAQDFLMVVKFYFQLYFDLQDVQKSFDRFLQHKSNKCNEITPYQHK